MIISNSRSCVGSRHFILLFHIALHDFTLRPENALVFTGPTAFGLVRFTVPEPGERDNKTFGYRLLAFSQTAAPRSPQFIPAAGPVVRTEYLCRAVFFYSKGLD